MEFHWPCIYNYWLLVIKDNTMFYGSILFRFFGVLLRWTVINCVFLFFKKGKKVKFKEVWVGRQNNDFSSKASHEMSDILIGFVFIITICALLFFLKV